MTVLLRPGIWWRCFVYAALIVGIVEAQVPSSTGQTSAPTTTRRSPSTITPWTHSEGADFIGYYDYVGWTSMRCGRNSFLASDSWNAYCCNSADNSCITAAGKRGDDCVDRAGKVVGICDSGKECTGVTIVRTSNDYEKRTFFLCSGAAHIANTWYRTTYDLTTSTTSTSTSSSSSSAGANVLRPSFAFMLDWIPGMLLG